MRRFGAGLPLGALGDSLAALLALALVGAQSVAYSQPFASIGEAESVAVQIRIGVDQEESAWPLEMEFDAALIDVLPGAEVLLVIDDLHLEETRDQNPRWVGSLGCTLGESPSPDALARSLFNLDALASGRWPVMFSPDGFLVGFGRVGPGTEIMDRDLTESLAHTSFSRLMTPAQRPSATRIGPDDRWRWRSAPPFHQPNFDLLTVDSELPDASAIPRDSFGGIYERMIQSSLNVGQTTLEHCRGVWEIDPLTGAIARDTVEFQVINHGWLNQRFVGRWVADYTWQWRDEPPRPED